MTASLARPTTTVGIGQSAASAEAGVVIRALGLGSCIGVVLIDPYARVAGMAHVMLPEATPGAAGPPGRFADTAVPALVAAVVALGAQRAQLVATIAGGAQMFGAGSGGGPTIGERNAAAVREALAAAGVPVRAADLGGPAGRTMQVRVDTGEVVVRAVGGDPVPL